MLMRTFTSELVEAAFVRMATPSGPIFANTLAHILPIGSDFARLVSKSRTTTRAALPTSSNPKKIRASPLAAMSFTTAGELLRKYRKASFDSRMRCAIATCGSAGAEYPCSHALMVFSL
jgi:hypothetical protein